jgi:hypothetical protein
MMAALLTASYPAGAQSAPLPPDSGFGRTIEPLLIGANSPYLDESQSDGWMRELSVSGYLQNTTGMWSNAVALSRFGRSSGEHYGKNALAVERELFQLDVNYALNADQQFFLRFWGVYEPPYPWEAGNIAGPSHRFNHSQSQIYNRHDVREAYWKSTWGPLTLFSGRQIVTWGESIAFRVGDVVNPQDLSWNFGFADLEQSRMPLWMLHPIVALPSVGAFGSDFIEGIWSAAYQPLYTGVSYADQRYQGLDNVAGTVDLLPPSGGRFDTCPYPFTTPELTPPGAQAAFPQIRNFVSPFESFRLPPDDWSHSTGGMRLHSVADDAEMTLIYWHGHQFEPTAFVTGTPRSGQNIKLRYPDLDDVGATINRPLYFGGPLAELPLVTRAEGVWQARTPFNTIDPDQASAVRYSSTYNTLVALDLDNLAIPWLTSTGGLTTNLEWNNYSILSPSKNFVYGGYAERWRHNEENLLFDASTSWWWGAVVPTFTTIYNPDGDTWLMFPNVVLNPPWTNKYSLMLEYIGILGNDRFSAYSGGTFKGKSLLLMQFQYNFNLIRGGE